MGALAVDQIGTHPRALVGVHKIDAASARFGYARQRHRDPHPHRLGGARTALYALNHVYDSPWVNLNAQRWVLLSGVTRAKNNLLEFRMAAWCAVDKSGNF